MSTNVGSMDRTIRGALSVLLLLLAFITDWGGVGWQHWVLIAIGAVTGLTALIGTCPLYALVGLNTCRVR